MGHLPVLLAEVLSALAPKDGETYVDGTFGGGGHTAALAERVLPGGHVFASDLDPSALERGQSLAETLPITLASGSFSDLPLLLPEALVGTVDVDPQAIKEGLIGGNRGKRQSSRF